MVVSERRQTATPLGRSAAELDRARPTTLHSRSAAWPNLNSPHLGPSFVATLSPSKGWNVGEDGLRTVSSFDFMPVRASQRSFRVSLSSSIARVELLDPWSGDTSRFALTTRGSDAESSHNFRMLGSDLGREKFHVYHYQWSSSSIGDTLINGHRFNESRFA